MTGFLLSTVLLAGTAQAADRRVAVDPNAAPWASIAKVQTNIGGHCTGVLIAPRIVLTAAHCLYNPRTRAMLQPLSVHVLFGYERSGYRWHRLVSQVETGPGFDAAHLGGASDWARLELAEGAPAAPLPRFEGGVHAGLAVALAGYNQDRAQLLMADPECRLTRVERVPGKGLLLLHDCDGTHGTSGAPLLAKTDDGWHVVGINIAVGHAGNLALAAGFGE